jgi:bifunctional DNA primase/polymerase-like protein
MTKLERGRRSRRQRAHKNAGENSRAKVASQYASLGLPVAPLHGKTANGCCTCGNAECSQPGKHLRTKRATTDRALIAGYWSKWPRARIGVVLGRKSGLLVVVAEGSAGKKTLRALEEKAQ